MTERKIERTWWLADQQVRKNLPPGVKLLRSLRGHVGSIGHIAWSADGRILASPSQDGTIRLWNAKTAECLWALQTPGSGCVAFDSTGRRLVSAGSLYQPFPDNKLKFWDAANGVLLREIKGTPANIKCVAFNATENILASGGLNSIIQLWHLPEWHLIRTLEARGHEVQCLAFAPSGHTLISGGLDHTVRLWEVATGKSIRTLRGHDLGVNGIAIDSQGRTVATGGDDHTVQLWEVATGRLLRTFEGPTGAVVSVDFTQDGLVLAAKCVDGSIRFWRSDKGEPIAEIRPSGYSNSGSLSFHPQLPVLASVGPDFSTPSEHQDILIHIWKLDIGLLLRQTATTRTCHYVNAKVVLLGDTGVGKSGLSLVLNGRPFEATDSTSGRRVWTFESRDVELDDRRQQTRETLLWDLAGQPGYRIIHQLHLNEVAVALVVFDARSEIDPLAGVRHWERALRLAQQRQGTSSVPMKKFLVSARADRGSVSVRKKRL